MNIETAKKLLLDRGMRGNAVSFNSGILLAAEQYVIERGGPMWVVYYYERGEKNNLRMFSDEGSACEYLIHVLEKDKTVWIF